MYDFGDDAPNFEFDSDDENRIALELKEIEQNKVINKNDCSLNKKRRLNESSILTENSLGRDQLAIHLGIEFPKELPTKINQNDDIERTKRSSRNHLISNEFKYLNLTLPSGKNSRLKMFTKDSDILNYEFDSSNTDTFLSKPIRLLKLEIAAEEEQNRKIAIQEINSGVYQVGSTDNFNAEVDLWVEKFRPKDYFELLSDDGTNRLILTWIKSWDYFVFGKEIEKDRQEKKSRSVVATGTAGAGGKNTLGSSKKRKRIAEDEMAERLLELDELNRPKVKVALISGPPGLGKTTLAQIISKRAGYNCIEMNASDDRNAESFKQYIESVTQIRGMVNDANMKPNCLIIDEIDGAPQNAIQVLIDHITETKKSKGNETKRCLRPIICICNDLYAPALKQLRQVSMVFQCQTISTHRLAERLRHICLVSKLDVETDGLIALCDKTSNDIRSCLNTLQFLSKKTNRISFKLLNEINIGQKDIEKNMFVIMSEIFFKKLDKKENLSDEKNKISMILQMCQNCDLDRLMQALFENFFFIRFRDSNFEMVNKAEEWLIFYDKLNHLIRHNQDYSFVGYQKYLPVLFHLLFSSTNAQINSHNKRFSYPHYLFESEMKFLKNKKITGGFLNEMSSTARVYHNSCSYSIIDLLPYLTQILQMNIRPVAIQLLNKVEKERFDSLINLMILFNLNYRQEKMSDGQFGFVLDPPIDELIKLNGMKQHKQLPNMIRQQISREITITRVKSLDKSKTESDSKYGTKNSTSNVTNKTKSMFNMKNVGQISKDNQANNTKKALNTNIKEKTGLYNFFQKIVSNDTNKKSGPNKEEKVRKLNDGVWLKYKEGYINAVKYNIKINKLL